MAIALLLLAVALATLLATRHYDSLISERKNSHNVLGMTTVQRRAAINTYARSFVWDYKVSDGTTSINSAKPAYKNAKPSSATDCSVFVYEVISHSGADSAFPTSGAQAQLNYVKSVKYPASAGSFLAGTKVYTILTGINSNYQASVVNGVTQSSRVALQPGDLLFVPGYHAMIYTGQMKSGSKYYGAEASNNQRVPSAANIYWWLSNYSNIVAARVR